MDRQKKESSEISKEVLLEMGLSRPSGDLPSPADTDDTILQFGEQCIRDVCAAEAEMNTPFARVP